MTWESGSSDRQRLRAGYAALGGGVSILLFAWLMAAWRGPQVGGHAAVRHEKLVPPGPNEFLPDIQLGMIICGAGLFLVLVLSVLAFLRVSRKYRDHILHRPPAPTPTSDVWQMHKVPDITGPDDETEETRD
ncbi:MAG: hypothetical protein V3W34_12130 [Phycisphaerae bacterium]